jgi:hypothetical protein
MVQLTVVLGPVEEGLLHRSLNKALIHHKDVHCAKRNHQINVYWSLLAISVDPTNDLVPRYFRPGDVLKWRESESDLT